MAGRPRSRMRRNGVMVPMIACVIVEPVQISAGPWKGPGYPRPEPEFALECSEKVVDMFGFMDVVKSAEKWGGSVVWLRRLQPGTPTASAEDEARQVCGAVGAMRFPNEDAAVSAAKRLVDRFDRSGDARKMVAYARKLPGVRT